MRVTKDKIKKGLSIVVIVLISSAISVLGVQFFKEKIINTKTKNESYDFCNLWAMKMTRRAIIAGADYKKAGEIEKLYKKICLEKDFDKKVKYSEKLFHLLHEAKFYPTNTNIREEEVDKYEIIPICRLTDKGDKSIPLCDSK